MQPRSEQKSTKETYPITSGMACLGGATGVAQRALFTVVLPRSGCASAARFGAGFSGPASFPCGRLVTRGSRNDPALVAFCNFLGGSTLTSPPDGGATLPMLIGFSASSSGQSHKRSGFGDLPTWRTTLASAPTDSVSANSTFSPVDSRLRPSRLARLPRPAPSPRHTCVKP